MPRKALFLHIQKTAGTSVINIAMEHYRNSIIHHGDHVGHQPREFTDTQFVSGHFGYEFACSLFPGRYSFTFLRDPMERILSFYYFLRSQDPRLFPMYQYAHETPLEEFLQAGFQHPLVKPRIWNNQTWQLAYGGYSDPSQKMPDDFKPGELLNMATDHLGAFNHIGFTETFVEDQEVILDALELPARRYEVVANANPKRKAVSDMSGNTLRLLNELTELDRELYKYAWERRQIKLPIAAEPSRPSTRPFKVARKITHVLKRRLKI